MRIIALTFMFTFFVCVTSSPLVVFVSVGHVCVVRVWKSQERFLEDANDAPGSLAQLRAPL